MSRTSISSLSPSMPTPKFGTIDMWTALTGVSRRMTYEYLARGDLKAVKVGERTMIDIEKGLAWMGSLPPAQIKAQKPRKVLA